MYNDVRDELAHHGILGMKWGVRRYQNKDGSLTPAGKKRAEEKEKSQIDKKLQKDSKQIHRQHDLRSANRQEVLKAYNKDRLANKELSEKWDKAFKAGKGTKEWDDYEQANHRQTMKFAKQYTEAFLKDVGLTNVSDVGAKYAQDKLYPTERKEASR